MMRILVYLKLQVYAGLRAKSISKAEFRVCQKFIFLCKIRTINIGPRLADWDSNHKAKPGSRFGLVVLRDRTQHIIFIICFNGLYDQLTRITKFYMIYSRNYCIYKVLWFDCAN